MGCSQIGQLDGTLGLQYRRRDGGSALNLFYRAGTVSDSVSQSYPPENVGTTTSVTGRSSGVSSGTGVPSTSTALPSAR